MSPGPRISFALLVVLSLTACVGGGTDVLNQPLSAALLKGEGPISQGGYRAGALARDRSPSTLVLLSFSGGGKRSAAFGYGVLKGLRDYPVTVDGSSKRM